MKAATLSSRRQESEISQLVGTGKIRSKNIGIGRILAPIDFSEASRQAVDHAFLLSKQFDAQLNLVHVFEPEYSIAGFVAMPLLVSDSEVKRRVRRHLHDVVRSHHTLLPKENIHVIKGRAFEEVCRLSARIGVDLIVISTHGNTGLKHLVLGSTAERIVRHAACPVLVFRPGQAISDGNRKSTRGSLSLGKIVVPVDFSGCSLKGLDYAKRLAKQFGSTLVLLHSVPPQYYATNEEYARCDLPLLAGQIEKAAREQLQELAAETKREGFKVETALEMGHPGQQICERAADRRADLVVTATHGNTGLKHVFLGSTAEYVVRHATCSVLVVPTRVRPVPK